MRHLYLFILAICCSGALYAQRDIVISIQDANTGEPLPFALIELPSIGKSKYSDDNGAFVLYKEWLSSKDTIRVSYIGYTTKKIAIASLVDNSKLIIKLISRVDLPVVEVVTPRQITNGSLSLLSPRISELRRTPLLAGESDLLKALQLLPGISGTSEGDAGISIRGGNTSQTHLIIDGNPIYNATHIGGFLSSLPSFGIKKIDIYKGGIPARFGGRLSGVIDVEIRKGRNNGHYHEFSLGTGLLRIGSEGILNQNWTYLVSGRIAYPTLIAGVFSSGSFKKNETGSFETFNLRDGIAKISGEYGKLELSTSIFGTGDSGFSQFDELGMNFVFDDFSWSNISISQTIKYQLAPKLNASILGQLTKYNYNLFSRQVIGNQNLIDESEISSSAKLDEPSAKINLAYNFNETSRLIIGSQYLAHKFENRQQFSSLEIDSIGFNRNESSPEYAVYTDLSTRLFDDKLRIDAGLRWARLSSDSIFTFLEPRLKIGWRLGNRFGINFSFDRNNQFTHRLAADETIFPNEFWIISNTDYVPANSDQYAFGFSLELAKQKLFLATEIFTKKLFNLTEPSPFRSRNSVDAVDFLNSALTNGNGRAKGLEVYLSYKNTYSSIDLSYTLIESDRSFPTLNEGEWFPYTFNHRHDIALKASHDLPKSWSINGTFVYRTGRAVTIPTLTNALFNTFDSVNNGRFPSFHRLNIGISKQWNKNNRNSILTFSVYNVYNRDNPYAISLTPVNITGENPITGESIIIRREIRISSRSLFPLIPGISYTIGLTSKKNTTDQKQSIINDSTSLFHESSNQRGPRLQEASIIY